LAGVMVDRPYSNGKHGWSKMDFSDIFSDPQVWIEKLNDQYGLQFLTWIAPCTFSDENFPGLLPGYYSYMDLTDPAAKKEWFTRLNQNQYAYGVKGHKMDRADEHFPVSELWKDRTGEAARRNKYVYLYAQVADSMLQAAWGKDQFNYARAAYQGAQPYLSALWGGDSRASWDGMASNMANAVRSSFMGFPDWGTDVGGYLGESGKIPEELFIRWMQWGAFNGLYEIKYDGPGGAGEDRAPWHGSEQLQEAFRKACEMRMEWLPYIFSNLNTSDKNGPLMKPIAMVYPDDVKAYDQWSEYLFGDGLLVAPVFSDVEQRSIYFPEGTWVDTKYHKTFDGPATVEYEVGLSEIPVFVRGNSILVKGNVLQGNRKIWSKEKSFVDVYYYPDRYNIENSTFDFIDPEADNQTATIRALAEEAGFFLNIPQISYPGMVKIRLEGSPKSVSLNGKKAKYTTEDGFMTVKRPDAGECVIEVIF